MLAKPSPSPMIQQGEASIPDQGATIRSAASRYYRPELDALRFLAFLSVFFFHRMDYVPIDPHHYPRLFALGVLGAFGVPVFFLLSAFLITELLLREREQTGQIHIQAFYVRRILRIWPLYFAALLGLTLLNRALPGVASNDPVAWLAFTVFAGNWYVVHHSWIAGSFDPLWSISVEEQFYLIIPVVAALGGRRALQIASILMLACSYLTVLLYALHSTPGDHGEWTNSFVHFQFFCAGTLLAVLLRGRLPRVALPFRVAGFVVGFDCWLVALERFDVRSWDPQPTPLGALLGWGLVLAGTTLFFLSALGTPSRLVPAPIAYLGRISYGLYIFHSFLFFLVFDKAGPALGRRFPSIHPPASLSSGGGTLLVLALSIGVAHLSYQYFERPFLRLKRRFTFVAAREESPDPVAVGSQNSDGPR